MNYDRDGHPLFAFQDLDYVPFGYAGVFAPYIETGPGTMRAAAELMGLVGGKASQHPNTAAAATVICDLGCGDGEFRRHAQRRPFSSQ